MKKRSLSLERAPALTGRLRVPGDKSITHRALILSAMASGRSVISDPLFARDCLSTAAAMRRLGATVTRRGNSLQVTGVGERGFREPQGVLDFGNSGTGLRLTAGALAGSPVFAVLDGDSSLRRRPMDRIILPLSRMGAEFRGRDGDRYPPLAVRGGSLEGIDYRSPVASAQVKSAVLLAGLAARGTTRLTEPKLSRDHTERMLPAFGAELSRDGNVVCLSGPQGLRGTDVRIPGDISSAAFLLAAALVVPGSSLVVEGVGLNPTRTGVLEILRMMSGRIDWEVREEWGGEPVGNVRAEHSSLRGVEITGELVPSAIDELPVISVAAAAAEGKTVISGASELRVKESDRIAAMASQLSMMGADIRETPDGMEIRGGRPLRGARLDSRGDHRVAMSLAVAALIAEGRTVIEDAGNIDTSFPGFEETLHRAAGR